MIFEFIDTVAKMEPAAGAGYPVGGA
jgi:hypothetical protein